MNEIGDPGRAGTRTWRMWTMADTRAVLIALGALSIGIGALVLANDVAPAQYPAIIAWMVGALIVHDVLIAGLVFAVVVIGRKSARRISSRAIIVAQSGLAVGAIVTLVVVPEIVKKAIGTANPSVLPLDYAANLGVFLLVLAVATGAGVLMHAGLGRQVARRRTGS